jgi:hypothetical protein
VAFTIRPPFDIDKELAEKTFDAIILSVPAMDIHDKAGSLAPTSRVALSRVGVGVVVKEGAPVPDVSTPEKLKAAVLAARSHGAGRLLHGCHGTGTGSLNDVRRERDQFCAELRARSTSAAPKR